jgi:hypothetical protein
MTTHQKRIALVITLWLTLGTFIFLFILLLKKLLGVI